MNTTVTDSEYNQLMHLEARNKVIFGISVLPHYQRTHKVNLFDAGPFGSTLCELHS